MLFFKKFLIGVIFFLLAPYIAASAYGFCKAMADARPKRVYAVRRRPMTVDEVVHLALSEINRQSRSHTW